MFSRRTKRNASKSTSRSRSPSPSISPSSESLSSGSNDGRKTKSSFAAVRNCFDKKFSSLKRQNAWEAEENASKKRTVEHEVEFKFKSNKTQFEFNASLVEDLGSVLNML